MRRDDPFFDLYERTIRWKHGDASTDASVKRLVSDVGNNADIPTLKECRMFLRNDEAAAYRSRAQSLKHRLTNMVADTIAAIFIYISFTLTIESFVIVTHAVLATYFYCRRYTHFSAKLDFSFLAFSIVFPLTFLIQSVFSRRDQALQRLMDFKSALLSTALFTLTCDWTSKDGSPVGGRLMLPPNFNKIVLDDLRNLLQLVYQYLSMPSVAHARNMVFRPKQKSIRRVHAVQNELIQRLNKCMFDMSLHTEVMRRYGFPSGEASRLHQFHQYLQQRFEHLRALKYYRTPQSTRSFGRAYLIILPWLIGPYFAWVYEETNRDYGFTLTLAGFTYVILLGLLNTQRGLEDPFVPDPGIWTQGIDNVKLDYECAAILQAMAQYYSNAEALSLAAKTMSTGGDPVCDV